MFGELAAIDGEPRSASVLALKSALIGRLSQAAFEDLVDNHRSFAWTLLAHLSSMVRDMTGRIFEYSTLPVRERLVLELLRLADSDAIDSNKAVISPAPTHFDLAARISTHREAVSREMSALAKQGLLEKRAGILQLHNIGALKALCSSLN
jgi:CRP-like cAMP-binding protein